MDILVSIVIPVYNSKYYLKECLNSVITQTYENLEILLIDDGSTDGSSYICDNYAKYDSRIKVFHNQNHGVSYSRNYGINKANGIYLLFVDSDDVINEDYINKMIMSTINYDYDLIISNIENVYENRSKNRVVDSKKLTTFFNKDYYILKELIREPFGKLYKKSIVINYGIKFPEDMKIAEDQVFNFQYYSKIKNYKFLNYVGYKYFIRKNFSLSKATDREAFDNELQKLEIEKIFYDNNLIEHKEYILSTYALAIIYKYFYLSDSSNSYKDFKIRSLKVKEFLYGYNYYKNLKEYFVLKCLKYNFWIVLYLACKIKFILRKYSV